MNFETVTKCLTFHEKRVDEICCQIRKFIELRSGFGEDHKLSRTLQNVFKTFDLDHKGTVTVAEFVKALCFMNISITGEDEAIDCFNCFDTKRKTVVSHKEFSDAVFGLVKAPYGSADVRVIIRRIKKSIYQRSSVTSIHNTASDSMVPALTRSLMMISRNTSSGFRDCLSKEELFNCLQKSGIKDITVGDIDILLEHFDIGKSGLINVPEFLEAIRGRLPMSRKVLVLQAFVTLDSNCTNTISVREMMSRFDATRHPRVVSGERKCEDIMRDFLEAFWDKSGDDTVTIQEWVDHYTDISAGIDRDDYFELMMMSCWHIPVEDDVHTPRRVLVSHKDGHKTIEEINDDSAVVPDNKAKMLADLRAQGIDDVLKIDTYS